MLAASLYRTWLSDIQELIKELIEECLRLRNITNEKATNSTNPLRVEEVVTLQEDIKQTLRPIEPLVEDLSEWFGTNQFARVDYACVGCRVEYSQVVIREGIRRLIEAARRIQDVLDGLLDAPTLRLSLEPPRLDSAEGTKAKKGLSVTDEKLHSLIGPPAFGTLSDPEIWRRYRRCAEARIGRIAKEPFRLKLKRIRRHYGYPFSGQIKKSVKSRLEAVKNGQSI